MNAATLARRLADRRIRGACRRLPEAMREERLLEWTAEFPGAPPPSPRGPGLRATVGVGIWLLFVVTIVSLVREFQPHSFLQILPGLLAAIGFVAVCVADLARAKQASYLPRWAWPLACMLWIPPGGIMYFSTGRVRRPARAKSRRAG